ncbi:MAG: sulfurtransferase TusA family protein [Bacillota bacterium]
MATRPQFSIPETIKEDTTDYQQQVERFLNGDLDPVRFKGYRVPMGVYGQRGQTAGADKYMIRVRAPGGVITREQLSLLNDLSSQYGADYLHFTTRQDIQIHQVDMKDTPEILYKLLEAGLSPRGGGGNTVRNIMNSSRAGVNPEDEFDTTAYSLALTEYLIKTRSSFNLPRKYKIAFSSTAEDEALATINDLGFIAKKEDGVKGFKVYGAGGMGNEPEIALLLEEFIVADKIFHVAEAIKRFFDDYGDRSNKHQARLRFVRKKLGDEEFISKYKEYLQEVLEEGIATEEINHYQELRPQASDSSLDLTADYLYSEQETGYYSIELRPPEGDINSKELHELLDVLETEELSLRTTNKQGLIIRGVKANQVASLVAEIKQINAELLVANVATMPIACKGASTCRLGLCLSPNLAEAIRDKLSALEQSIQNLLPQIYISGCPNCCGQHLIGQIGFEGKAKRFNDRLVPHYSLLVGGNIGEDQSKYGSNLVDIPAKRIPDFLAELANLLATEADYDGDFNSYLEQGGREKVIELAQEFTTIPSYEQEADLYQDWGSDEDFSLAGRGPGECGTGVMDIVQLDIDTAKDNYRAGKEEDNEKLYQAIVDAARALLIVRGIDTEKDRVILDSFQSEFIANGLVDSSRSELLDAAFDYKLGDIDSLSDYQTDIEELIERVEELFESLNSNLEFALEDDKQEQVIEDNNQATVETELADLRGVDCPMNFVKAKVAIAPLDSGAILEIYLDPGEPIENVPQSLAKEGHEILNQEQSKEGHYILTVKKGD